MTEAQATRSRAYGPECGFPLTRDMVAPLKIERRPLQVSKRRQPDECWPSRFWGKLEEYGGYALKEGTGYRTIKAHRAVAAHVFGSVAAGAVVMHTCDHPGCVNPLHLRIGTQADNQADMAAKGRAGMLGKVWTPAMRAKASRRSKADPNNAIHLRDRPNHPCCKPVITPSGRFPSAILAAEALGVSANSARAWAAAGLKGWSYEIATIQLAA